MGDSLPILFGRAPGRLISSLLTALALIPSPAFANSCDNKLETLVAALAPRWRMGLAPAESTALGAGGTRRAEDFLATLSDPVVLRGPPESGAIRRAGIPLTGGGNHTASLDATGGTLRLTPAGPGEGGGRTYDGVEYLEFPNSTLLQTTDSVTSRTRSFLLARGVRRYTTNVDLTTGKMSPQGYVSDVLAFELVDGRAVYHSSILQSSPTQGFLFEDPRISVLHFPDGTRKTFLSGTDYSPHISGSVNPDVMNRYVELKMNKYGAPLPVATNPRGIPSFSNLSPFPRILPNGEGVLSIDAKNATIAFNEEGQVVVRTRLRPDFNSPAIRAMAGTDRWNYGEQVFVFNNYDEFSRYDWNHCLEDLFRTAPLVETRVRPSLARVILRDSQIRETYPDARVLPANGKGLGPGTPPVRAIRRGNQLFISDGPNAPEVLAGPVPGGFPLRDGEVTYLTFDHEIRYFEDVRGGHRFLKRHYSMTVRRFDPTLSTIEAYYADALQPRETHELGYNSGIADLQHVYPMGREVHADAAGLGRVRVSLGVSDAHTEIVEVDPVALLMELAPGSERWRTGQIYRP